MYTENLPDGIISVNIINIFLRCIFYTGETPAFFHAKCGCRHRAAVQPRLQKVVPEEAAALRCARIGGGIFHTLNFRSGRTACGKVGSIPAAAVRLWCGQTWVGQSDAGPPQHRVLGWVPPQRCIPCGQEEGFPSPGTRLCFCA